MKTSFPTAGLLLLAAASVSAAPASFRGLLDEPLPQIVNGTEAPKFKYTKWMVGLLDETETPETRHPFCGASYIGNNWVLTAAHCAIFYKDDPTPYYAEARRHNYSDPTEEGLKLKITKVFIHPQYDDNSQSHDIALLQVTNGPELEVYPELDDGILSSEDEERIFKIIGWGTTSSGGNLSNVLLEAFVDLSPTALCQDLYKNASLIDPTMICAKRDGIDTCQGDSGGPMFVERDATTPVVIVGLTSWGEGCAQAEPGVYTRVSVLRQFVDETIGCAPGTTYTGGKCQ